MLCIIAGLFQFGGEMKSSRKEGKSPDKKSWQALEGRKTYNVCVTCMKKGKFKVVNETNHYYGKAEVYSDMLAYCYSLQVSPKHFEVILYYLCEVWIVNQVTAENRLKLQWCIVGKYIV